MKKIRLRKMISAAMTVSLLAGMAFPHMGMGQAKAASDLETGLIGYWTFDGNDAAARLQNQVDGSDVTAAISGNGAEDSEDGGIHGGAIHFHGAENSSLRINLKGANQGLNTAENDFTIAAWVMYDSSMDASGKKSLFQQTETNGRTILYLNTNWKYGTYLASADAEMSSRTAERKAWHYVTLTWNHSNKKMTCYMNGEKAGEQILSQSPNTATDLLIGANKNGAASAAVKGSVDELRYYNRELTASDALELYQYKNYPSQIPQPEPEKPIDVSLTVEPDKELRKISDAMFGINHRYHNNGYDTWDTGQNKIADAFHESVKEADFGSIRYPGGTVSNTYDWKGAIGTDRKPQVHGAPSDPLPVEPNFGVDEAMKWIYDDLDAEAIWVYGMGIGSAADAVDLFEYLNAEVGQDPNGDGVDWASVRAANGHEKPYGVTQFEIGNEMAEWGQNYWMTGSNYNQNAFIYVNGGEMSYTKQNAVKQGDWRGSAANSDGTAGQVRYARFAPVTQGTAHIFVGNTEWTITESLQGKTNSCLFDYETGAITFGDGTNGNIPANGQAIKVTYSAHRDGFVDYYDALKDIAQKMGMEVGVYSCMYREAAITELNKTGKYDGAVFHPYSETSQNGGEYIKIQNDDPEFYEKMLGRSLEHNMPRVESLIGRMAEGKVPVISEFGVYSHNNRYSRSLGHAIYIANEMIDYIGYGTPYLNKHCLVDYPYSSDSVGNGSQCVIQTIKPGVNDRDDEGENATTASEITYVSTPSARLYSIMSKMTGSTQVKQTMKSSDSEQFNKYYTFSNAGKSFDVKAAKAIASKDADGNTYVTVVNNQKEAEIHFDLEIKGRDLTGETAEIMYLTSEDAYDVNTLTNPNRVSVKTTKATAEGKKLSYILEPHSVTAFKIPSQKFEVKATSSTGGTASVSETSVSAGTEVTFTANVQAEYRFLGWYEGDRKVSSEPVYKTIVTESLELQARFEKKPEEVFDPSKPIDGGISTDGIKTEITEKEAVFRWTAVNGADGYVIEILDTKTNTWTEIQTVSKTTVSIFGLKAGVEYTYRVRAYQMIQGKKVYFANAAEIKIEIPETKVGTPKGLKVKKISKGLKVSWKKVKDANGYILYRSYKKNKGFKKIATLKKSSKKMYLDKKAKKGKTAYYKVRAYKNTGKKKKLGSFSKIVKKKR